MELHRFSNQKMMHIQRNTSKIIELFNNSSILTIPINVVFLKKTTDRTFFAVKLSFQNKQDSADVRPAKRRRGDAGSYVSEGYTTSMHNIIDLDNEEQNKFFQENTISDIASSAVKYTISSKEIIAEGAGVISNSNYAGLKLASLLFQLQLYCIFKSGAPIFYLNNATDQPGRAAGRGGIYSLLEPDITSKGYGMTIDRKELSGLTIDDKMHKVEGGMRLKFPGDFFQLWKTKINSIFLKLHELSLTGKNILPWSNLKNIEIFISKLIESGYKGGRRKPKVRRKSKRRRKSKHRRKSKRHRKTKRR